MQAAAEFELSATGERSIRLADLKPHIVVLYFYPKDNTPGCTLEGEDFRRLHDEFSRHNAVVLGVSRDSLRSHENFKCKKDFPFELISDADEKLCEAFGVIKLKNMYGKQVRGIERSTFVLDSAGLVCREWRGVKVPGHAQTVLDFVKTL
jgi:peroxiredoxin Q/BCP